MLVTKSLSASVDIFSRHKKDKKLKDAVESKTVGNIDYTSYQSYRAVTKACALNYFPTLFVKEGAKQKFVLKDKVVTSLNGQGSIQFEQKAVDQASVELANTIKPFLDSILMFCFDGNVNNTQNLPLIWLKDPHSRYFSSSRLNTRDALIKRYKDKYDVELDLKSFTCPLSGSVKYEHSKEGQIEHIEDQAVIFHKLLAGVYVLNKLKPVDEKASMRDKFDDLKLNFRQDTKTNPDLKQTKRFIFAKKVLAVHLLSDIRNLVFLCKRCNTKKPKGVGWSVAMKSDPFKTVVDDGLKRDMNTDSKKCCGEKGIIEFDLTQRFQAEVINRFKDQEAQQQLIDARRYLDRLARVQGVSLSELVERVKNVDLKKEI